MKVGLGCGIVRLKEREKKVLLNMPSDGLECVCDVAEEMMWD